MFKKNRTYVLLSACLSFFLTFAGSSLSASQASGSGSNRKVPDKESYLTQGLDRLEEESLDRTEYFYAKMPDNDRLLGCAQQRFVEGNIWSYKSKFEKLIDPKKIALWNQIQQDWKQDQRIYQTFQEVQPGTLYGLQNNLNQSANDKFAKMKISEFGKKTESEFSRDQRYQTGENPDSTNTDLYTMVFANRNYGGGYLSGGWVQEEQIVYKKPMMLGLGECHFRNRNSLDVNPLVITGLIDIYQAFPRHRIKLNEQFQKNCNTISLAVRRHYSDPSRGSKKPLGNGNYDFGDGSIIGSFDAYKYEEILHLLHLIYSGFKLAKHVTDDDKGVLIETGLLGCGAFNNNPVLMILLQMIAADLAGVNLRFHDITDSFESVGGATRKTDKIPYASLPCYQAAEGLNNQIRTMCSSNDLIIGDIVNELVEMKFIPGNVTYGQAVQQSSSQGSSAAGMSFFGRMKTRIRKLFGYSDETEQPEALPVDEVSEQPPMSTAKKAAIGTGVVIGTGAVIAAAHKYRKNKAQERLIEDLLGIDESGNIPKEKRTEVVAALNRIADDVDLPDATRDQARDLAQQVQNGETVEIQQIRNLLKSVGLAQTDESKVQEIAPEAIEAE